MTQNTNETLPVGVKTFPFREAVWTKDKTGGRGLRGHMKSTGKLRYTIALVPIFMCGEGVET